MGAGPVFGDGVSANGLHAPCFFDTEFAIHGP
jgi:hypothetical protein